MITTGEVRLMISANEKTLAFQFVPDPARRGRCGILPLLRELDAHCHLRCFRESFGDGDERWGNCHDVSTSLAVDLLLCGLGDGWRYVTAEEEPGKRPGWGHTWLEFDGWAVDGSERSLRGRVLVRPARHYRERFTRLGWVWTWDKTIIETIAEPSDDSEEEQREAERWRRMVQLLGEQRSGSAFDTPCRSLWPPNPMQVR